MIGKTNALAGMKQKQEMVNISLSSNQASHEDLVGAVITLSYGEYTEEIVWSGNEVTRAVPAYVEYTVSFGDVENHKTPAAVTNTSVEGNVRSITGTYLTELVSVTLAADDGASMAGQTVTINGTEHTFDGNAVEQKVAYGVTYTVSVSDKDGYAAPNAQTFTAAQSGRNLELVYIASALKVNILSNQENDENIAAVKAVVTYGDTSVEVSNGQQIGIPTNVEVTITFPEVEGYKTPDAISFTNSGGMVEKTVTYLTEVLTVNVGADNGTPTGYEVTISKHETVGVATKYTKLEYIESTGTQYIDTGVSVSPSNGGKLKYVIDAAITGDLSHANLNGTGWGADPINNSFYVGFFQGQMGYGNGRVDVAVDNTAADNNRHTFVYDAKNGIASISDVQEASFVYQAPDTALSLSLFGYTQTSAVVMHSEKMYSCKIYEDDILIRDYIPALRADGIAGLYDAVNDTFYASSGSGNFIAPSVVEEVIAVQTSVTGTYKIPFDNSYQVSASTVAGFDAPSVQTFIADSVSRVVDVTYTEVKTETLTVNVNADDGASVDGQNVTVVGTPNVENGVYIQDTDGKLWAESDWDGSKTPNGIAVVTSECRFVMALADASNATESWGSSSSVSGVCTALNNNSAKADYNGKSNTEYILAVLDYGAPSVCSAYTFPNGQKGYTGACGEWQAAVSNKSAIVSALAKCGGVAMSNKYWSSTQLDGVDGWAMLWEESSVTSAPKYNGYYARAFAPLTTTETQPVTNGKATFTIPYDTEYTVSVDEKSGYTSPASQTYTASQATRSITMTYEAPKVENLIVNVTSSDGSSTVGSAVYVEIKNVANGIYIQDIDGNLWTESAWNGSKTPNGIAVVTDNCRFVIALGETDSSVWYGRSSLWGTAYTDETSAFGDCNGRAISENIVDYTYPESSAFGSAYDYIFPNGNRGYVGSLGEWACVMDNYSAIESAFVKCGGILSSNLFWCSTEYDASYAWAIETPTGTAGRMEKTEYSAVYPFTTLGWSQHVGTDGKASFTIPVGTTYEVSVSANDSYITPASQTYTAASGSRTVTMNYVYHAGTTNPTNGVYIQDTDGYCHTADAWDKANTPYTPNGIAVITDDCSFVIALKYIQYGNTSYMWGASKLFSNVGNATSVSNAILDYNGKSNTENILADSNQEAALYCSQYVFPNGKNGYLGAAGEWRVLMDNKSAIDACITATGAGQNINNNLPTWTSTQNGASSAWYALPLSSGTIASYSRTEVAALLPFTTL